MATSPFPGPRGLVFGGIGEDDFFFEPENFGERRWRLKLLFFKG